jgi:hypothetical protein
VRPGKATRQIGFAAGVPVLAPRQAVLLAKQAYVSGHQKRIAGQRTRPSHGNPVIAFTREITELIRT